MFITTSSPFTPNTFALTAPITSLSDEDLDRFLDDALDFLSQDDPILQRIGGKVKKRKAREILTRLIKHEYWLSTKSHQYKYSKLMDILDPSGRRIIQRTRADGLIDPKGFVKTILKNFENHSVWFPITFEDSGRKFEVDVLGIRSQHYGVEGRRHPKLPPNKGGIRIIKGGDFDKDKVVQRVLRVFYRLDASEGGVKEFFENLLLGDTQSLSFWMTQKEAITLRRIIGGKGALFLATFEKDDEARTWRVKSPPGIRHLPNLQAAAYQHGYLLAEAGVTGPHKDVPAPDVGTTFLMGSYMEGDLVYRLEKTEEIEDNDDTYNREPELATILKTIHNATGYVTKNIKNHRRYRQITLIKDISTGDVNWDALKNKIRPTIREMRRDPDLVVNETILDDIERAMESQSKRINQILMMLEHELARGMFMRGIRSLQESFPEFYDSMFSHPLFSGIRSPGQPILTYAAALYLQTFKKPVPELSTYTGKPVELGGLRGRLEATGYGGMYITERVVRDTLNQVRYFHLRLTDDEIAGGIDALELPRNSNRLFLFFLEKILRGEEIDDEKPLTGMTMAIQGFGNVGANAALMATKLGAFVTRISDHTVVLKSTRDEGFHFDEIRRMVHWVNTDDATIRREGLPTNLARYYEHKILDPQDKDFDSHAFTVIGPVSYNPPNDASDREDRDQFKADLNARTKIILESDTDILVLAALENQITDKNLMTKETEGDPNRIQVRAPLLVELANGPIDGAARDSLLEEGFFIIPDILANVAGVIGSTLEMLQAQEAKLYTVFVSHGEVAYESTEELRKIVVAATEELLGYTEDLEVPLVRAVSILANLYIKYGYHIYDDDATVSARKRRRIGRAVDVISDQLREDEDFLNYEPEKLDINAKLLDLYEIFLKAGEATDEERIKVLDATRDLIQYFNDDREKLNDIKEVYLNLLDLTLSDQDKFDLRLIIKFALYLLDNQDPDLGFKGMVQRFDRQFLSFPIVFEKAA